MDWVDKGAAALAVYGLVVYVTGFRSLWAAVFEMSLQPQKIILFYLLSRLAEYLILRRQKMAYAVIAAVILSSLVYSVSRFNKRFLFFRKDPWKGQVRQRMALPRLKGMVIPQTQADDITQ